MVAMGATQGITLFTALLPDRAKVFNAEPTPAIVRDVRNGEMIAGTLTLGFGALMATLSGNVLPLWVAAFTVAAMVTSYELTLARKAEQ